MQRLLRGLARPSTFVPILALIAMLFGASAQIIPQNTLAIITNGLFISVSVMVIAAYTPALLSSLRSDAVKDDQYLITGILLFWLAISASRVWSLVIIMAGKPDWMINHWFQTFCYIAAASSGFYFLQITGHSRIGYRYTTAAIVLAVAVVTFTLAFFEA